LAASLALGLPRPRGGYQRSARNTGDRAGTSAATRSPRWGHTTCGCVSGRVPHRP